MFPAFVTRIGYLLQLVITTVITTIFVCSLVYLFRLYQIEPDLLPSVQLRNDQWHRVTDTVRRVKWNMATASSAHKPFKQNTLKNPLGFVSLHTEGMSEDDAVVASVVEVEERSVNVRYAPSKRERSKSQKTNKTLGRQVVLPEKQKRINDKRGRRGKPTRIRLGNFEKSLDDCV